LAQNRKKGGKAKRAKRKFTNFGPPVTPPNLGTVAVTPLRRTVGKSVPQRAIPCQSVEQETQLGIGSKAVRRYSKARNFLLKMGDGSGSAGEAIAHTGGL